MVTKFTDLALNAQIQKTLKHIKFETPAQIQAEAIPVALEGKDIIGISQTGTGKTAAYALPSINNIKANKKPQVLIISSTRELVSQIDREVYRFAFNMNIHTLAIYGGSSFGRQKAILNKGVEVLVATPGRLLDLTKQGVIDYSNLKTIVVDEADEMLQMGFIDDIKTVLSYKPDDCQILLFSATMPTEISDLATTFMKDPVTIDCSQAEVSTASVSHFTISTLSSYRVEAINHLISEHDPRLVIIFANTKKAAADIAYDLRKLKIKADAIHGDLRQREREKVMHRFRKGFLKVLVATDVAARGIDVRNVDMVINYDLPLDKEFYVHRTGRTGRAGKDGSAYSFITEQKEFELFDKIKKYAAIEPSTYEIEGAPRLMRKRRERNNSRNNSRNNYRGGRQRFNRNSRRGRQFSKKKVVFEVEI